MINIAETVYWKSP